MSRTVVERKKKEVLPMRFKIDAPEGYAPMSSRRNSHTTEPQAFTKDPPSKDTTSGKGSHTRGGDKRGATAPVKSREGQEHGRKVSVPKFFDDIAHMDNELQVHCQFSKFRRMPMTEEQQAWLEERAENRMQKDKEYMGTVSGKPKSAPAKKGGNKATPKGTKKNAKKAPPSMPTAKVPAGPKYASATDFMEKHFPNFDGEEFPDAQGALR